MNRIIRRSFRGCLISVLVTIFGGCGRPDEVPRQSTESTSSSRQSQSSFTLASQAANQGRWQEASELVGGALIERPDDPETLQLAADIAFGNDKPELAVEFIREAAYANGFQDEDLIDDAEKALLMVGRLHDAIELLENAVQRFPDRHQARRRLFDFLINTEQHHRARPHGRILVRQRKFDLDLLLALSTYEQRHREGNSMAVLAKRNPNDPRLGIASLRLQFDTASWKGMEESLAQILDYDAENTVAQILLGRYFVETNQLDRLDQWTKRLTPEIKATWEYWMIVGEWAFAQQRYAEAARAYWESSQRNRDIGEVFAKLARTLYILQSQRQDINESTLKAVNQRAELLGRFMQDKERFYRLGSNSKTIIVDIAKSLLDLGRVWEAEAWMAIAIAKVDAEVESEQDVKSFREFRERIVKQLSATTPWQISEGHPEFDLDLSAYPVPQISESSIATVVATNEPFHPSVSPVLTDEAIQRGLYREPVLSKQFDDVIPIYAQMESGGCAVDYDRDGWPDLFVAASGGTPGERNSAANRLYRNVAGNFVDVSKLTGTDDRAFAQGVTFGDVNADGFHDIVVLNYGINQLLINNGDGTFRDAKHWFPKSDGPSWSTSGAIADLNSDGLADLVCLKYCAGMDAVEIPCRNPVTNAVVPCLPTRFAAQRDDVFSGMPEGGFQYATDHWSMIPVQPGRGLGVVVGDLDSTNGLDIFVANDMTANHFWNAQVGNSFSLVETAMIKGLALDGRFRPQACMGIATADFDDDGDVDLFVTNFEQEHNTIYEQNSLGIWSDRTLSRGLMENSFSQLGFGTQAVDFDNDSLNEIAITNGHIYKDAHPSSTYAQKMQVLRRKSHSKYEAIEFPPSDDYVNRNHVGRAMWKIDADRDGRIDLVVTHQTEPLALLMNQTPTDHSWIKLQLVGVDCERDAIGSTVTINRGKLQRMAPLVSGDGFYCGNQRVLHFGLGSDEDLSSTAIVQVRWPNGEQQNETLLINREYIVVQGRDAFDVSH